MILNSKKSYAGICVIAIIVCTFFSCDQPTNSIDLPIPTKSAYGVDASSLSPEQYYDKVLGALVGSAIGDAMGASTEMWHRSQIQKEYGYITGLTTARREKSPEGTWGHNLDSGSTTDDTRWKFLMTKYLSQHRADLSSDNFSNFITTYYNSIAGDLSDKALKSADALDEQLEKLNWVIEWNAVAKAHQEGPQEFQDAKSRFYGGEMSCAGMLYSPMFGLINASPDSAYLEAYDHSLFDIGYARDITAMVAAMTSVAMHYNDVDSIINAIEYVDPLKYKNSRLIGRLSESSLKAGLSYIQNARSMDTSDSLSIKPPQGYPYGNEEWVRQNYVYEQLQSSEMPISFHSGEIWQILVTGIKFGEGDFSRSMEFIVNFGRDNDTVAAVAGMILGAKDGYTKLPQAIREEVIRVNRDQLGIDLEELAREITLKG